MNHSYRRAFMLIFPQYNKIALHLKSNYNKYTQEGKTQANSEYRYCKKKLENCFKKLKLKYTFTGNDPFELINKDAITTSNREDREDTDEDVTSDKESQFGSSESIEIDKNIKMAEELMTLLNMGKSTRIGIVCQ